MPTPTAQTKGHQDQWKEIVRDPALQGLAYKVETNERGQILLSPHQNQHSFRQYNIQKLLEEHAPSGVVPPEFALATPKGVKAPDVVWMSPDRREDIEETGDPTTLAPELCVEVLIRAQVGKPHSWSAGDRVLFWAGPPLEIPIHGSVMSESNTWDEMHDKRKLYREAGAREVWIVAPSGRVRFFGTEEMDASHIAPAFPETL